MQNFFPCMFLFVRIHTNAFQLYHQTDAFGAVQRVSPLSSVAWFRSTSFRIVSVVRESVDLWNYPLKRKQCDRILVYYAFGLGFCTAKLRILVYEFAETACYFHI